MNVTGWEERTDWWDEKIGDGQGPWIAEIPLHCVIEAWKPGEKAPPQ